LWFFAHSIGALSPFRSGPHLGHAGTGRRPSRRCHARRPRPANRLNVSIKTIETYRSNIKVRLRLKDATELIRCAASWVERF
jgi:hypothetical protein